MDDQIQPGKGTVPLSDRPAARSDEIVERVIDRNLLVYDLRQQRVHILNETAALVWQLCNGNRSTADISELLASHYPGHESSARSDVAELVEAFAQEQLLRV